MNPKKLQIFLYKICFIIFFFLGVLFCTNFSWTNAKNKEEEKKSGHHFPFAMFMIINSPCTCSSFDIIADRI